MALFLNAYLEILRRKNYFILIMTLLLGQVASGFLLIALINSVYTQTESNFATSAVVLSIASPGFLLMAFSGLVADIFDRRKIIILANSFISLVVLLIIFSLDRVFASISLSFLYFAGNSFFIPAASAASTQLVKKDQITVANSIFILTLTGGQILGLFGAAIIHFFFVSKVVLIICEILLAACVFLPTLLPRLVPVAERVGLSRRLKDVWLGFFYVFKSKVIWFFFLVFSSMQGIVSFGATIGPGFFSKVMNLAINKASLLVMPLLGLGLIFGALFVNNPRIKESYFVSIGIGFLGITALILGMSLRLDLLPTQLLYLPLSLFLVACGFGVIVPMIASRAVLQRRVSHQYQGTVFGAYIILSAFLASVVSPIAALLVLLVGYVNIFIFAGLLFMVASAIISRVGRRWKF